MYIVRGQVVLSNEVVKKYFWIEKVPQGQEKSGEFILNQEKLNPSGKLPWWRDSTIKLMKSQRIIESQQCW